MLNGSEIVQVEYDPGKTQLSTIVQALKQENAFYSVIARDEAERARFSKLVSPSDIKVAHSDPHFVESKYSLRTQHPELYYLDLTEIQAIAFNSWSYFGGSMPDILNSEQQERLTRLKTALKHKSVSGLQPVRAGKGLDEYRMMLDHWLQE